MLHVTIPIEIEIEISSKLVTEAPDILLVSLLLTLNIFDTFFNVSFINFENVFVGWVGVCSGTYLQ